MIESERVKEIESAVRTQQTKTVVFRMTNGPMSHLPAPTTTVTTTEPDLKSSKHVAVNLKASAAISHNMNHNCVGAGSKSAASTRFQNGIVKQTFKVNTSNRNNHLDVRFYFRKSNYFILFL